MTATLLTNPCSLTGRVVALPQPSRSCVILIPKVIHGLHAGPVSIVAVGVRGGATSPVLIADPNVLLLARPRHQPSDGSKDSCRARGDRS